MLNPERMLTCKQISKLTRLPVRTIQRWIRKKELPAVKLRGQWLVQRSDFWEFARKTQLSAPPPRAK